MDFLFLNLFSGSAPYSPHAFSCFHCCFRGLSDAPPMDFLFLGFCFGLSYAPPMDFLALSLLGALFLKPLAWISFDFACFLFWAVVVSKWILQGGVLIEGGLKLGLAIAGGS